MVEHNPFSLAARHANHLEPVQHNRFMDAFRMTRVAEQPDRADPSFHSFHAALNADDSVTVAGILEGLASLRVTPRSGVEVAIATEYKRSHPTRSATRRRRGILTQTQRQAMLDAANGITVPRAAEKHGTTERAINQARFRARKALGASNTAHAVALAVALNILSPEEIKEAP